MVGSAESLVPSTVAFILSSPPVLGFPRAWYPAQGLPAALKWHLLLFWGGGGSSCNSCPALPPGRKRLDRRGQEPGEGAAAGAHDPHRAAQCHRKLPGRGPAEVTQLEGRGGSSCGSVWDTAPQPGPGQACLTVATPAHPGVPRPAPWGARLEGSSRGAQPPFPVPGRKRKTRCWKP